MSKLVYTALSKHSFYANMNVCAYVFREGAVSLNPFNLFGYFLYDLVDRDAVRAANNAVISRVDEVWAFGPVANGVAAEVVLAHEFGKKVRYFSVGPKIQDIGELRFDQLVFEDGVFDRYGAEMQGRAKKVGVV